LNEVEMCRKMAASVAIPNVMRVHVREVSHVQLGVKKNNLQIIKRHDNKIQSWPKICELVPL
jgi:hypothetical protein